MALTIKVFTSIYKKTQSKESFFSLDELRLNISWKLIFIQILTIGCSRVWESSNLQTWKAQVWKGKRTWNVLHHSLHGYLQVFVYPSICLSIKMSIHLSYIYPFGILRSGRAKGPGMFFIIPCMDTYRYYSIYPYVYPSKALSIHVFIYKYVYLSNCKLNISICLSIHMSINLFIYLAIYLEDKNL